MEPTEAKAYWTTNVSDVEEAAVYIRGYDLGDLIGRIPFSAATYLLIRGKLPTQGEARMVEAMLCSILDYSLYKPGTVAARYCVSGNPQMVAGMATAVLSVGEYTLAPEDSGRFIQESYARMKQAGVPPQEAATRFVAEYRASGLRVPGFGHPKFKTLDPRAQKLKKIARGEGVWGDICDWYENIHQAFITAAKKPEIPINEVGMMAAIMSQMGFTPAEMTGLALISSMPGVVAHVSEELQTKTRIRILPDEITEYPRTRKNLETDLAAAGWPKDRS